MVYTVEFKRNNYPNKGTNTKLIMSRGGKEVFRTVVTDNIPSLINEQS